MTKKKGRQLIKLSKRILDVYRGLELFDGVTNGRYTIERIAPHIIEIRDAIIDNENHEQPMCIGCQEM